MSNQMINKWYVLPFEGDKSIPTTVIFSVPSYQRGYRWTPNNLKKLIIDICSFTDSEYCLQPIVLQEIEVNQKYRVVDGQQRLTTIYIILKALKDLGALENEEPLWDIFYEVEEKYISSMKFGQTEDDKGTINDDFRSGIYEVAKNNVFNEIDRAKFCEKLKRTCVLVYEIPNNEDKDKDGHEAFRRLNDGKTPLTSSELIRALYMVNDNGIDNQNKMEISKEWELIENTLRGEQFWLMFNGKGLEDTPTRIDLLFALVVDIDLTVTKANPRIVFEKMEEMDGSGLEKVWLDVMRCFWWMESCYRDIEIFNYLGWIAMFTDKDAKTVYDEWKKNKSLDAFREVLIDIIKEDIGSDNLDFENINYNFDKKFLRKFFVLLNCLECNKTKERFRFDLYAEEKWDIEHIDSQTPNDLDRKEQILEWLSATYSELTDPQKNVKVEDPWGLEKGEDRNIFKYSGSDIKKDFEEMAKCMINAYRTEVGNNGKIEDGNKDKIGNLALLTSSVNRSYHNDIFPIKRTKIRNAVKSGDAYIPPCTQKAFMKFYTEKASRITYWLKEDFDAYQTHMEKLYNEFIGKEASGEQGTTDKVVSVEAGESSPEWKINNIQECPVVSKSNNEDSRLNGEISLIELMKKYQIVIPKIQRLYVQGRLDKRGKKCLEGFANTLVDTVVDSGKQLSLDFIYGIQDEAANNDNNKKVFYPMDGQQRLTTLLLLAWLCGITNKEWVFKYESRRATECFIKELLLKEPPSLTEKPGELKGLQEKKGYTSQCSDFIKTSDWFHLSWEKDPGIAAMLEMLDSLYYKLLKKSKLGSVKTDQIGNIKFYVQYLDVASKSYDQIFLKMNSRGKELTQWENIKAIIDQYAEDEWKIKINNTWPESLWKLMNDIEKVDSRLLLITELALACVGYKDRIENTYTLDKWFEKNKDSVKNFFTISSVFFNQLEDSCEIKKKALTPAWSKDPIEIKYLENTYEEFYKPLLVNYAMTKACCNIAKDWSRVVWNILENERFDKNTFKNAFGLIDELLAHSTNILQYLADDNNEIKSKFAEAQVKEERVKAKQILSDEGKTWYEVIKEAEKFAFFNGAIRFLYTDEGGGVNWNDFETKFKNAEKYFDEDGIEDDFKVNLIKTFVLSCDDWDSQLYEKQVFNPNAETWKGILCNTTWRKSIHNILMAENLGCVSCAESLNDGNATNFMLSQLCDFPYDYVIKKIPNGRFRWNGRLGFYPPSARDAITMDWGDFKRNNILSGHDFSSAQKIKGAPFFWGWDVVFEYEFKNVKYKFKWTAGDYVYLLDGIEFKIRNEKATDLPEKYFCFKVENEDKEVEKFKRKLEALI